VERAARGTALLGGAQIEDPSSFTGPLYYLSKSHEEVVQEHFQMFDEHIASERREESELIDLLKSLDAVQVFVPAKWRGINGFKPVSFEFKEEMPKKYTGVQRGPSTSGSFKMQGLSLRACAHICT